MLKNTNKQIEDLSQEKLTIIEEYTKSLGLENLKDNEKLAISYILNKKINPKVHTTSLETYPFINTKGLIMEQITSTNNSTFLISILRKNIELLESQSTLIDQNQQIIDQNNQVIELLTKISEK